MDIGNMNRRICIQKHTTKVDSIGNHTSTWEDYYSCFAYVNLTSGREYGYAPETISEDTLTFMIRWCRKLTQLNSKEYRICFESRFYDIIVADDVQYRHKKLKLTAKRSPRGDTNG